jgi:transposase
MIPPSGLGLAGCAYAGERFDGARQHIELRYAPPSRVHCRRCGCAMRSRGWRVRQPEHLPLGPYPCRLRVSYQRWRCPACAKVHAPELPGLLRRARMSTALKRFMAWLLRALQASVGGVARWLLVGWGTVWRALQAAAQSAPPAGPSAHLALDEVYFKRARYWSSCRKGRAARC